MAWNSVWTTAYWPLGDYQSPLVLENAQAAYDAMTGAGWTHNAAIAVLGNLCHESGGINPGQFENGKNYSWSWGFGIAQWTPGTKVSDYIGSQAQGVVDDGDKQIEFLINTPGQYNTVYLNPDGSSNYYGLSGLPYITNMYDYSQSNASIEDLTALWMVCWERPGAEYAALSTRVQYAQYFAEHINGRRRLPVWLLFKLSENNKRRY